MAKTLDYREGIPLIKAKLKELNGSITIIDRGLHRGVNAHFRKLETCETFEQWVLDAGWAVGGIFNLAESGAMIHLDDFKDAELWREP